MRKFSVTSAQSEFSDLFLSRFSKGWSQFSTSGFDQEEFIVDVVIPTLLPFCTKESVDEDTRPSTSVNINKIDH